MKPTEKENSPISLKQMREAINKSGYLLEQRIEAIVKQTASPIYPTYPIYTENNPIYKDPDTGKSCEIDLSIHISTQVFEDEFSFIFSKILCECENNSQPVVFFTSDAEHLVHCSNDMKISGIPIKFLFEKSKSYWRLTQYVDFDSIHHYCSGDVATQYCTFQTKKNNSGWMALHNDEQHNTFNKLVKAVNFYISQDYAAWELPQNAKKEPVNVNLYYPVLILQGDLFTAQLIGNRHSLKKSNPC
jgi:hypothetical protein